METIRTYLESMFKNLPQTDSVIKAKYELGQMMEDKYTELIKEGKSENEAVGIVITEFGNLEDLSSELGIDEVYKTNKTVIRRKLSIEEVKRYIQAFKTRSYMIAAGVALCISCVTGPIMSDAFKLRNTTGLILMFLMIAIAVALFILSKNVIEDFEFIDREPCSIEPSYLDTIKHEKRDYVSTYSVLMAVGVLLCVFCVVPTVIFDEFAFGSLEDLSGAMLFWCISAGVFLMIVAKNGKRVYERLLNLNKENVYSEPIVNESEENKDGKISNKTVRTIMSVYWPTVTCIYLIWSFMTFHWHYTWLIWPVAGVVQKLIINIYKDED